MTTHQDASARFRAMASDVTVRVIDPLRDPSDAMAQVEATFRDIERVCTRFDDGSDLMRANAQPGEWATVDPHCFAAIELARCAGAHADSRFPGGVAEAIIERLCDVPDSTLSLLKWLALCSDEIDVATIEALAAEAQVPSLESLDAALAAGVLLPVANRYRFRHHLVQQALAEQVLPHRRLKMHGRIAALLAGLEGPPADIARHWLAAGQRRDAMPWLLAAAREAVRLAAFSDVVRLLEPLLAFRPDHAEGLRLRAESLDAMGEPAALAAEQLRVSALQNVLLLQVIEELREGSVTRAAADMAILRAEMGPQLAAAHRAAAR